MNPFTKQIMKTITQKLSLAAFLATTTLTANAADIYVTNYATIQAAVDAANSGDTIHIAAGVYVEQVTFTHKDLALIGQPGTILRAFPNMGPGGNGVTQWRPILFVFQSTDVVLRNLTFEGDQLADQQVGYGLCGVAYYDSGGTVEDCRFTGFREKVPGSKQGAALRFLNNLPGASLLNVRAAGNTIEDSYVGIDVWGAPDKTSYNFAIEDNTIKGVSTSTTAEGSRRGVNLGDGITGSVTGNSISGFSYSGAGDPYPYAWGILAIGIPGPTNSAPLDFIRFENNTLRDNNQHLMVIRAINHEILNNHFEGTGLGQRPAGLWFSGENVRVQGNVFRDMEEGIRVGGMDPDWKTILGVATNAMLVDNRFCHVTNSINMQPQATATEQGTLFCPFPDPVLLLSWPVIDEGFSVQSGPTPSGPWSTVHTTPTRQNGQNTVVVPAAGDQQFFRLAKP